MYSMKNRLAILAGVTLLCSSAAAYADAIVVRSTGPSAKLYPPGKALPESVRIALKAGDTVTVLSKSGTNVLKGPGNIAPNSASAATGSSLASLMSNAGARQARTGATRGTGNTGPAHSPNIWYVDISKSGNVCLLNPSNATLWRGDTSAAATVSISNAAGKSANADFREGQAVRAWPLAEQPIMKDGGTYTFKVAAKVPSPVPATPIKVIILPAAIEGNNQIAEALIKNNCNAQVNVLADAAESLSAEGAH